MGAIIGSGMRQAFREYSEAALESLDGFRYPIINKPLTASATVNVLKTAFDYRAKWSLGRH
jgi:hypothetical protein